MKILPVAPDHIPALSALAEKTFCDTFAYLYPSRDLAEFLEKSYAPAVLASDVADPRQFWRMVWDNDTPIAYLQCGPVGLPHPDADPATQGELKRIYIDQAAQGRGLGKTLVKLSLDHFADTYGSAVQWIGVWSENLKAQALYASFGFERVGEYQFVVGATLDDEFILRRDPGKYR